MPRDSEAVSLIVFRVPNETSAESVWRMRAGETSASAADSAASRWRPMLTSGAFGADTGAIAAHATANARTLPVICRPSSAVRRPPSAVRRPSKHAHREERSQRVVRRAKPHGKHAHAAPEDLVGELAIEVEQELEVRARDRKDLGAAVRDGVGRALAAAEHGHLAEHRAGLEHGQRFLAAAGYRAADAHFALDDQEEPVPRLALPEHVFARHELLVAADFRNARELAVVEILEDGDLPQQVDHVRHGNRSVEGIGASREARWHGARWQAPEAPLAFGHMERETLATLPNLISLSRLGLAAAFVVLKGTNARLLVIAAAGATDFLDGYLARRGGSASKWGALIDPIADRFLDRQST